MNINLQNAIKSLVAKEGSGVLTNAGRVEEALPVFANKEITAERKALIACIASGLPAQLQQAHDSTTRTNCINRTVQTLTGKSEMPPALAQEVAAFIASLCPAQAATPPQQQYTAPPPQAQYAAPPQAAAQCVPPPQTQQQQYTPPEYQTQYVQPAQSATVEKGFTLSMRTFVFAAVSAIAALIADLIYRALFPSDYYQTNIELILHIMFWMGLTTLGIVGAILAAQSVYLKKAPAGNLIAKALAVGVVCGAAAGGLAQGIFNYTQFVSPTVSKVSRVLCWGLAGTGAGLGVGFFVPNYPRKRALLAGFIGGIAGGIFCLIVSGTVGSVIVGLCIGAAVVIVEESLREAWITVDWGHNETVNVSLGTMPVMLGSAREANIHLSSANYPPVALVVSIEQQKIIADNKLTGQRIELANGSEIQLGKIKIIAHKR